MTEIADPPKLIDGRWYLPVYRDGVLVAYAPAASHPDINPGSGAGWYGRKATGS